MSNMSKGFTIIEMMLSIAVIAIIAGIGTPIYQSTQVRNDLENASVAYAQSLRHAQILSRAMDGDTSWGVKIQSGSIVLFKGVSYATRDNTFDEVSDVPTSITPSGVTEIVFTKFTGLPATTGTLTLTSSLNDIKTITINEKGTIIY